MRISDWSSDVCSSDLPISLAVGFSVYRPTAELQARENDEAARRTGILFEAVSGAEGVKAQGGEPRFSDIWLHATRLAGDIGTGLRSLSSDRKSTRLNSSH